MKHSRVMTNEVEIRGPITAILLTRRDGTVIETLIDTEDLNRARSFPGRWYASWQDDTKQFRVTGVATVQGETLRAKLHRWLLEAPDELEVDHINNDTLDNRRSNLRLATRSENAQNRRSAQSNARSGLRGVHWHGQKGKWWARMCVGGKRYSLGLFETKEEAARAVSRARAELMPFSKEFLERRGASK